MIDGVAVFGYSVNFPKLLKSNLFEIDNALNKNADVNHLNLIDLETVYTSIKCDAPGNDQFFYFSREMLNKWWIPIIRPSLNYIYDVNSCSSLSPEYFIFNHCPRKQVIGSGLIRDYNKITSWIGYPGKPMTIENFWSDEKSYQKLKITIDAKLFLDKLKDISSRYNVIMNTDIPV